MKALFVAWRAEEHCGWGPVGRLEQDGKLYRYCYVAGARTLPGFRPFPGMDDLEQVYESAALFPLFANRLFSRSRKRERLDFLRWLGFDSHEQPDPIAILGVTEGIRQTDAMEVFPCPLPDAEGCYLNKFFLHGIRWRGDDAITRIGQLKSHEPLVLRPDPANPVDPFAVGVWTQDDVHVGYVPRYFARDTHRLLRYCQPSFIDVFAERMNSDAPLQHRLLCRIQACWPDEFRPCSGPEFLPIPQGVSTRCG